MTEDHERIDELLAGYALSALAGTDAEEAERLLDEHVPTCAICQDTLAAFDAVAAQVALSADPIQPPDLLLPRIHRQMEPIEPAARRWNLAGLAVAAGIVAIIALGGVAALQNQQMSQTEARANDILHALEVASRPDADRVPVGPATGITAPGEHALYIFGRNVPEPPPGTDYRVWLVTPAATLYAGDLWYQGGVVFLAISPVPEGVTDLWISIEPSTSAPGTQPSNPVWRSSAA